MQAMSEVLSREGLLRFEESDEADAEVLRVIDVQVISQPNTLLPTITHY